ncbi:unnamed protein product [Clavelina lepadiformis]|uniref:Uncharacterized protein n=1 Tax=Clavelina lepadiformis TaxID=159417 RepID=A0ABP0GIU2_CLALP
MNYIPGRGYAACMVLLPELLHNAVYRAGKIECFYSASIHHEEICRFLLVAFAIGVESGHNVEWGVTKVYNCDATQFFPAFECTINPSWDRCFYVGSGFHCICTYHNGDRKDCGNPKPIE